MASHSRRLACFSLDFELDFGGRLGTLETIRERDQLEKLAAALKRQNLPLSIFLQTSLISQGKEVLDALHLLGSDFHSHSHTHARHHFDSRRELETSKKLIEDEFGAKRIGYRAPLGKLYPGDLELVGELGYAFDASIFPSIRPGVFNHLRAPIEPGRLPGGLLEIPFGVLPGLRLILGISYMKLLGYPLYNLLMGLTGLPQIVVFYGHLHDFVETPGRQRLPRPVNWAFARNANQGVAILESFAEKLRQLGYEFTTMSALAEQLEQERLPEYRL